MEGPSELRLSKEEGFLEEEGQTTTGSQKRLSAEQAGSQWPAQHTGILAVVTVVGIPADVRAEQKGALISAALDIVQENRASAWAKVGLSRGCQSLATAQLVAQDTGCPQVPSIIAYSAPPLP